MFESHCWLKLIEMTITDSTKIEFGKEIQINNYQFLLPVIVDGVEMSVDEVNFIVEPHNVGGKSFYQPHIKIVPKYQHQGLGYGIFKSFLFEFGNIYCYKWCTVNPVAIGAIFDKLKLEHGVTHYEENKKFWFVSIE